jgi:nucleoside-diphosphate-sugar epimerase
VTGSIGRLGRKLIKLLSESNHEIRALDLPVAHWEIIRGIKNVELFPGDVTDLNIVTDACKDVEAVFHLAAILPPLSETNRGLTLKVNVEGTKNILEVMRLKKDVALIFASSISTYGITTCKDPLISEDYPQKAHNIYSKSKIEAERIIRASEIPYVVLRIAPIAIADLVELPDIVPYKANQRVEFISVDDAARALFSAAINKKALGRIFNIAGGASWQMTGAKYIERFYEALGVDVEPNFCEEYTTLDWYDTSRSRFLDYQRTTFNDFLDRLRVLGEGLGLR